MRNPVLKSIFSIQPAVWINSSCEFDNINNKHVSSLQIDETAAKLVYPLSFKHEEL